MRGAPGRRRASEEREEPGYHLPSGAPINKNAISPEKETQLRIQKFVVICFYCCLMLLDPQALQKGGPEAA